MNNLIDVDTQAFIIFFVGLTALIIFLFSGSGNSKKTQNDSDSDSFLPPTFTYESDSHDFDGDMGGDLF
jgi:hypothetical protein